MSLMEVMIYLIILEKIKVSGLFGDQNLLLKNPFSNMVVLHNVEN